MFKLSVTSKCGVNYYISVEGITNPVTFPALVKTDAKTLTASGVVTVNRTKFDIKFKLASFFENLGDKAIYNYFTLVMKLVATI